jgi:disulfide bond formation protein DsbB
MKSSMTVRILHAIALIAVSLIGLAPGIALTEWSSSWPFAGLAIHAGYWETAAGCGTFYSGFPFVYTREWGIAPGTLVPACTPETDWTVFGLDTVIWAFFSFGIFWAVLQLSGATFRRSFPQRGSPPASADAAVEQ